MAKKEWLDWLKCNLLEIIILILVLVLVVKAFSAPIVDEVSKAPAVLEEAPVAEIPLETSAVEAPAVVEGSTAPPPNATAPSPLPK